MQQPEPLARETCQMLGDNRDDASEQESLISVVIERRKRLVMEHLYENEKNWRFSPDDGGDPAEVSTFALQRELAIERQARRQLTLCQLAQEFDTHQEYLGMLAEIRDQIKYFPVLFISAPHIESDVSGTFPGIPTPLLYATAVLDRYLRIDEFPSLKVPNIKAVMNPSVFNDDFTRQLRDYMVRFKPRVVGISNLSEGHYFALQIARQIKAIDPKTIIIMGGAHEDGTNPEVYRRAAHRAHTNDIAPLKGVSRVQRAIYNLSEEQLARMDQLQTLAPTDERDLIDFVAAGDCPYLLMEFMKIVADHLGASSDQLKQIILDQRASFARLQGSGYLFFYNNQTQCIDNVTLSGTPLDRNKLPFIFLGHLTHENRFPVFGGKKTAQVMACIGCKYICTFCHESADQVLYEVPKLQQRDPENVVKELDLLKEQGYEAVFFDDSTFTQNPLMIERLLDQMAEKRTRTDDYFEWGCQTTINDVAPGLLHKMAAAGCSYIYFGLESADPSPQDVQKVSRLHLITGAHSWAERFRHVAYWCYEVGIRVGTSLQFGLHDSPEQRQQTIDLVAELYAAGYIAKHSVALNINTPYPGTDEWLALMKAERPLPDYRERLVRHPGFETAHQFAMLPRQEADEIYTMAVEKLGDALIGVQT
jgi:radical SAM superfamily enzyme YgiQ (UPF0313 family)